MISVERSVTRTRTSACFCAMAERSAFLASFLMSALIFSQPMTIRTMLPSQTKNALFATQPVIDFQISFTVISSLQQLFGVDKTGGHHLAAALLSEEADEPDDRPGHQGQDDGIAGEVEEDRTE